MPNTDRYCLHCYVTGKVQGVWFRANTKKAAEKLGITGYARNLPDGRVEVVAAGDAAQIEQLFEWLKEGPELAQVTDVTREQLPWREFADFQIR